MLNTEFRKKFNQQTNPLFKEAVKNDFLFFMKKMDSIENVALIGALLKIKNLEDLRKIKHKTVNVSDQNNTNHNREDHLAVNVEKTADYPGGMNALRKEVADLFYTEGVYSENPSLKTVVFFVVEKDGTISNVKAEGDNFTFNRQAEIAVYSISGKFSPANINGMPVRYRFRFPLAMNFE